MKILVISRYHPDSLVFDDIGGGSSENGDAVIPDPILGEAEQRNDNLDLFNHPRFRRAIILRELSKRQKNDNGHTLNYDIVFETPSSHCKDLNAYKCVHTDGLLDFLLHAWKRWVAMGDSGRDPGSALEYDSNTNTTDDDTADTAISIEPALIPGHVVLHRDRNQRPSKNVMGQIGYYCTDNCTAIFAQLKDELLWDSTIIQQAVKTASTTDSSELALVYALVTHPGHHASTDCFGGYCYVNHAALAAKLFQETKKFSKVAVLDVDYHVGNGTASIFYEDPTVLVISIHCHPDYDYPFHSGFEDETGEGDAVGTTLHLPLKPKTTWTEYSVAVKTALDKIVNDFGAEALVLSLGLDTHDGDPCAVRRAGFKLEVDNRDYLEMGKMIGAACGKIPTLVIQEGGYRMDKVPKAAADVLCGYAEGAAS